MRRLGHQHLQVRDRAREHVVVDGIGGLEGRHRAALARARAARAAQGAEEAPLGLLGELAVAALHGHGDRPALARGELQLELRASRREPCRRRAEADARAAGQSVHRVVAEVHFVPAHHGGMDRAAARAPVAPHLEEIGEVGAEVDRATQPRRLIRIAREREDLVAAAVPEELGARHVEGVLRHHQALALEEVRVRQVHVEHHVVGLHRRAQDERPVAFESEVQAGEMARVVVEEPGRVARHLDRVAELVEHGEGVAVLERAPARRGERDDRRDDERRALGRGLAPHAALAARSLSER